MDQEHSLSFKHPYAITANLAFRRKAGEEIGFFDKSLSFQEDVDFSWRLQQKGYVISFAPEARVYHKNIKLKRHLFIKLFRAGVHAPRVIKKNLEFLERHERLRRVNWEHYARLGRCLVRLLMPSQDVERREELKLELVWLTARKAGLILGSLRFLFLYI